MAESKVDKWNNCWELPQVGVKPVTSVTSASVRLSSYDLSNHCAVSNRVDLVKSSFLLRKLPNWVKWLKSVSAADMIRARVEFSKSKRKKLQCFLYSMCDCDCVVGLLLNLTEKNLTVSLWRIPQGWFVAPCIRIRKQKGFQVNIVCWDTVHKTLVGFFYYEIHKILNVAGGKHRHCHKYINQIKVSSWKWLKIWLWISKHS